MDLQIHDLERYWNRFWIGIVGSTRVGSIAS